MSSRAVAKGGSAVVVLLSAALIWLWIRDAPAVPPENLAPIDHQYAAPKHLTAGDWTWSPETPEDTVITFQRGEALAVSGELKSDISRWSNWHIRRLREQRTFNREHTQKLEQTAFHLSVKLRFRSANRDPVAERFGHNITLREKYTPPEKIVLEGKGEAPDEPGMYVLELDMRSRPYNTKDQSLVETHVLARVLARVE